MDTHPPLTLSGTDLPSAAQAEQRVVEARRLFQRTLAKWASDVLMIRQRCAHSDLAPDRPAWAGSAPHQATVIHPAHGGDGWSQAA